MELKLFRKQLKKSIDNNWLNSDLGESTQQALEIIEAHLYSCEGCQEDLSKWLEDKGLDVLFNIENELSRDSNLLKWICDLS